MPYTPSQSLSLLDKPSGALARRDRRRQGQKASGILGENEICKKIRGRKRGCSEAASVKLPESLALRVTPDLRHENQLIGPRTDFPGWKGMKSHAFSPLFPRQNSPSLFWPVFPTGILPPIIPLDLLPRFSWQGLGGDAIASLFSTGCHPAATIFFSRLGSPRPSLAFWLGWEADAIGSPLGAIVGTVPRTETEKMAAIGRHIKPWIEDRMSRHPAFFPEQEWQGVDTCDSSTPGRKKGYFSDLFHRNSRLKRGRPTIFLVGRRSFTAIPPFPPMKGKSGHSFSFFSCS
jgi:hypothetical protein